MKISSVKAFPVSCAEPNDGGRIRSYTLVRVESSDGHQGWGEARCHTGTGDGALATKLVVERGLAPLLLGREPSDLSTLILGHQRLHVLVQWWNRRLCAKRCRDCSPGILRGKIFGVPCYVFLGGKTREKIKASASMIFDIDNIERNVELASKCVATGFRAVKFGWGLTPDRTFGLDQKHDLEIVRAIREKIGPNVDFMIDVGPNAKWDVHKAITWSKELAKFDLSWLEEPLARNDYEGYKQLRKSSTIPIAGGEWEYFIEGIMRYIDSNCLDIIEPEVGRFGGMGPCKEAADIAERYHLKYSPHTWNLQ